MGGLAACFLDRDGVVNEVIDRVEYRGGDGRIRRFSAPWSYSEFKLRPRVKEALMLLGQLGFLRILVTNQPDMAYGRLSLLDHDKIMAEIWALPLDDVYVCPHRSVDGCGCKKPKPGMLLAASRKWGVDLARSFMVGDRDVDMETGGSVGCRTILVCTAENKNVEADFYADDLLGAALLIQKLLR